MLATRRGAPAVSCGPPASQREATDSSMCNSAREVDMSQLAKVKRSEKDCVVPNQCNTYGHRLRDNIRRDTTRRKQASARSAASNRLTELETEISDMQARQRETQSKIRQLREETKALKANGAR